MDAPVLTPTETIILWVAISWLLGGAVAMCSVAFALRDREEG